jgi:type IV pilus assembly protein PilM
MRRSSSTVALDIGPDAIVVVQSSGTERARLRRAIVHPLPVGIVVDGEVVNSEALASELRTLFGEHKLPRDVRVGLAHPRLMVRMVELPATLDGPELAGAVRHLAVDLLPVALDQLVVDYRRVGRTRDQQRILMAAARLDGIERLMVALDAAGLRCQRIQLSGLALPAALDHPKLEDEAILYVAAGALTNVVITEDDQPLLVRAASAGSESIAAGLAERAGITHETARSHVAAIGVGSLPRPGSPEPMADDLDATISLQVREGLRRIVAEVQSSRGFYSARADARPISAVVLTGAMTTWPGVADALRDELHLPVLAAGRESWPDLGDTSLAPERLDVAVGLALAADNERPDLRPSRSVRNRGRAVPSRLAQVACAMTALLAAAVVYLVVISNQVSSGRERLGQISGEMIATEHHAARLRPYADFAGATIKRREAVTQVANTRFKWDGALTELAQVAPAGIWLTSAKGTLTPTTQVEGGAGDGTTSGLRAAIAAPALELVGCAARESAVPAYMDRLHAMTGVTEVGFSRSERLEKSGERAVGTASSDGDCRGNDLKAARFAIVTYFNSSPAVAAAAGAPAAPGPAPTPAATPPSKSASKTAAGDAQAPATSHQTAAAMTGVTP